MSDHHRLRDRGAFRHQQQVLTGIPDLESDQRGNQGKADSIRDDDHEIAFENAIPDPQGESGREYRKRFERDVVG